MSSIWQVFDAIGVPVAAALAGVLGLLALAGTWVVSRRRRARQSPIATAEVASPLAVSNRPPMSLRHGLAKTRSGVLKSLLPLLGRAKLDATAVEALADALVAADVGVRTTERLLRSVQERPVGGRDPLLERLKREVLTILQTPAESSQMMASAGSPTPRVIMVVGVNGVGKTTSIGKLAARYQQSGKRTLLVAGDTFRAAAIEQLAVWAERTGADLVRHQHGSDPGAVAYDGIRAAIARGVDVVIVDTAGRLHTKSNLMEELQKVRRILARELPGAPHETLLVIDAVTGQNGLAQARAFMEHLEVTGVVLTKLDGTAKGGIVLAIAGELGLPIRYAGIGEAVDDLRDFEPEEFVSALLGPVEPTELP